MKKYMIPLLVLLILAATGANAQIYFKNNNSEPVHVAFARYVSSDNGGYWQTQGWWTVKSGSTHLAFETIGPADTIGYWCMTTLSTDTYEGTKSLLVHPDEKFIIRYADKVAAGETHPTWEWFKFRLVGLRPGVTSGTISFKE
jgi:hypothetical protein